MLFCVINCIFEHMTDKIFPVTGHPFGDPWPPIAPSQTGGTEVLEPSLILRCC